MLGHFVRGRVYLHFASVAEAQLAMQHSGFSQARVFAPPPQAARGGAIDRKGASLVRIIEAGTSPRA
jgi:hypothetical protein